MNHVLVPRLCNNTPQRSHLLLITHHAFIDPLKMDGMDRRKRIVGRFGHFGDDSSKKKMAFFFFPCRSLVSVDVLFHLFHTCSKLCYLLLDLSLPYLSLRGLLVFRPHTATCMFLPSRSVFSKVIFKVIFSLFFFFPVLF